MSEPAISSRRLITIAEFKAELTAQDVPREHFAVVCVQCGTVQSRQDFVDAGVFPTVEEAQSQWGFSCIGRSVAGRGCDWTLGGLFHIHKLEVDPGGGEKPFPCFEPATAEQAQAHMRRRHVKAADD